MQKLRYVLGSALICTALATPVAPVAADAAPKAPPLGVDLDKFDSSKRTMQLPNGIALGYAEIGPHQGRPIVLIHGYTDNARDWVPMLPYLDKSARLILVDIRGHGLSSKPECCYTRFDFAYDIKLLLDALHVAEADIVGHSLGSIIAQTFAEFWPERTHRLVLIASTGGSHPSCPASAVKAMDYRSEIAKLKDPIDPDSLWMVEWWSSPTPVDEDFIRRQRKDSAQIPIKVWLAVLDQGDARIDLQPMLPRIKAPTLLIWGEKDPIMVEKDRCALIRGLPSAEVKVFPGLGHNPFWEQPKAVADTLQAFLKQQP